MFVDDQKLLALILFHNRTPTIISICLKCVPPIPLQSAVNKNSKTAKYSIYEYSINRKYEMIKQRPMTAVTTWTQLKTTLSLGNDGHTTNIVQHTCDDFVLHMNEIVCRTFSVSSYIFCLTYFSLSLPMPSVCVLCCVYTIWFFILFVAYEFIMLCACVAVRVYYYYLPNSEQQTSVIFQSCTAISLIRFGVKWNNK